MLAWCMGRRMLWGAASSRPPFLHTSLVWLLSFFPAFSCFCSGTLLCRRLSQPPVALCPSPWTRGASGTLGLARLPWKGSKKPPLGGWGGLADPTCPIPLSLRISRGPWGVPGKGGFVYVYGKIRRGQSGALGFRHRPGKGFPPQRRGGEEGHLLLPILSGPLEGLFALVRMLWQGHKSTLYFGSWLKITRPTNMVESCV